ncbi:phosphomannomutase [Theileria orientalis]|uniref:Phosphomannomutase n=1 Tax=Theileria orientalis TaxID=68886 RepID=A0A976MAC4_THEOR|nr:phosphomannomutase [Theileria orientalis]
MENGSTILLFDLDETLADSFQVVSQEMKDCLQMCMDKGYHIGVVSGSDFQKVEFQMKQDLLNKFEFSFCENGTQVYQRGNLVHSECMLNYLDDAYLNELFNYVLRYIADLDIPKKRGCFIERRKSVINISPIGRNCSESERREFYDLDAKIKVRQKLRDDLTERFKDKEPKLRFSLGGKISVDCFLDGWSKEFCVKFLSSYNTIHFFGDMTHPGGNDYELFIHPRVIGHAVANYRDTIKQLKVLFLEKE